MNEPFCPMIGVCGGCAWGMRPHAEQLHDKLAAVSELASRAGIVASFVKLPTSGLRDRADLVWFEDSLGLYGLEDRSRIVDLEACPMMTPALAAFYAEFRARKPPGISRGSVRLRVSPSGERGVWLDFANADVKRLFDERSYLRWLSSVAFVEIGQRRKALVWREGDVPKLVDPVLKPWFETYDGDGRAIPLMGPVGGFSQAGFVANRALVACVADAVGASGVGEWMELFSGNGNFALAMAARGIPVVAYEMDLLAVEGMRASTRPEWPLTIERLDVYLKTSSLPSVGARGLLVDPPRAGLRETLGWIERERPTAIVYVSCFADVFAGEASRLMTMGYRLVTLKGVDQFAHSPHAEWIGLFVRG